jgi:hypothetical protein
MLFSESVTFLHAEYQRFSADLYTPQHGCSESHDRFGVLINLKVQQCSSDSTRDTVKFKVKVVSIFRPMKDNPF